mmetsp:Transcript_38879/g.109862  ORF Transcript_38879/g.109862 Transcript_38879/m.109862 type:complete len:236 (+) Transcript_38879:926-1633(+)
MSSGSFNAEISVIDFGVGTVGFAFTSRSSVHFPPNLEMDQFWCSLCPGHCGWVAASSFFSLSSVFHSRSLARFGCVRLCCSVAKLSRTSLKFLVSTVTAGLVSLWDGSTVSAAILLRTPASLCAFSPSSMVVSWASEDGAAIGMPAMSSPCSSPIVMTWFTPPHWKSSVVRPSRCLSVTAAFMRQVVSWEPVPLMAVAPKAASLARPWPSTVETPLSVIRSFGGCASPEPGWPSA